MSEAEADLGSQPRSQKRCLRHLPLVTHHQCRELLLLTWPWPGALLIHHHQQHLQTLFISLGTYGITNSGQQQWLRWSPTDRHTAVQRWSAQGQLPDGCTRQLVQTLGAGATSPGGMAHRSQ